MFIWTTITTIITSPLTNVLLRQHPLHPPQPIAMLSVHFQQNGSVINVGCSICVKKTFSSGKPNGTGLSNRKLSEKMEYSDAEVFLFSRFYRICRKDHCAFRFLVSVRNEKEQSFHWQVFWYCQMVYTLIPSYQELSQTTQMPLSWTFSYISPTEL